MAATSAFAGTKDFLGGVNNGFPRATDPPAPTCKGDPYGDLECKSNAYYYVPEFSFYIVKSIQSHPGGKSGTDFGCGHLASASRSALVGAADEHQLLLYLSRSILKQMLQKLEV